MFYIQTLLTLLVAFFSYSCASALDKETVISENLSFFEDGKGVSESVQFPHDNITVENGKLTFASSYVNTTEIGLYLNILTLIEKGILQSPRITPKFAKERIIKILQTLDTLETWKGLFYWPYSFENNALTGKSHEVVPAVDNGNLSFSIAAVAGAYLDSQDENEKKIVQLANRILERQKEGYLSIYDTKQKLLSAGWDIHSNKMLGYHIDRKMNESRLATIWAILFTDKKVPVEAFSNMDLKTVKYRKLDGSEISYYITWDGTIFQALLPAIFLEEDILIKDYDKVRNIVYAQEDYIQKNWIPAFISAASTPENGYRGMGIDEMAELVIGYKNPSTYVDFGTPHATALTYLVDKKLAMKHLSRLRTRYPGIDSGGFGWYDCISKDGRINSKILSLDQGMLVLAFYSKETRSYVKKFLKSKGKIEVLNEIYSHFHE